MAADKQGKYELFPEQLPGKPGEKGSDQLGSPPEEARTGSRVRKPSSTSHRRLQLAAGETSPMLRFLLVRIASSIPVLIILSIVTFAIIRAPPGSYADYIRSQLINQSSASFEAADAQAQAYRVANGLDQPMVVQYFAWMKGIITEGDFGYSMFYNKPVADVVAERLPRTAHLVCHILASLLGIGFGIWAATRQYSWIDSLLSGISFLGMTVPRFLMALIIVYLLVFSSTSVAISSPGCYGGAP